MRILFVSDTYYPHLNGVYYFVCRIGLLLEAKGHKVAVIAPSESRKPSFKKVDGIDVYGMPSLPVLYYPKIRFASPYLLKNHVRKLIKSFNPDIIHLQDHFPIAKAVLEVNKKMGIPIIGTNHFMPENITAMLPFENWKGQATKMLWGNFAKAYNQVSIVTTPTETGAKLIRPFLKNKVVAISSGIDLNQFNPEGDTPKIREKYKLSDKPILLFVGRIDPEKKLDEILKAVALAVKKVDFKFVIVGKGIKKTALEALAKELGIADHVIFTGFVPDEDLPYFYKLGRCFVIASIAELLSLATLQAMASGMPVIAVNAGALHELVHHNSNGFLFNSGDIETLDKVICQIITDDHLYERMCKESIEIAKTHDIQRTLVAFEKLYLENSKTGVNKRIIRKQYQGI